MRVLARLELLELREVLELCELPEVLELPEELVEVELFLEGFRVFFLFLELHFNLLVRARRLSVMCFNAAEDSLKRLRLSNMYYTLHFFLEKK